jgi:hypothetical protein
MKHTSLVVVAVVSAAPLCEGAFVRQHLAPPSFVPHPRSTRSFAETPIISGMSAELESDIVEEDRITSKSQGAFVNDGPFSWMTNYLFLHETGKSMAFGIPVDADESRETSPDQIARQKQELATNLMNIGMEERERRRQAGNVFVVVTAVYALWAALVGDHGDFQGHVLRFMSVLPLFLAQGYRKSAKAGL